MRPYVIRQGDYLAQLAHRFGFDADTVWNDDLNEAIRRMRPNPQELAPGDILHIPNERPAPLSVTRGSTNSYSGRIPTVEVHFTLKQGNDVIADEPFEVHGAGAPIRGTTDSDGKLHAKVPVTKRIVELFFPEMRLRVPVLVGGLDPLSTNSGVKQRLANLGLAGWTSHLIDTGKPMHQDELNKLSILGFQRKYGLPVTGELDPATREAIGEAYEGRRQPVDEENDEQGGAS